MPTENDTDRLLELWAAPVTEEMPCGEDCSFDPEFEQVQAEAAKDTPRP